MIILIKYICIFICGDYETETFWLSAKVLTVLILGAINDKACQDSGRVSNRNTIEVLERSLNTIKETSTFIKELDSKTIRCELWDAEPGIGCSDK